MNKRPQESEDPLPSAKKPRPLPPAPPPPSGASASKEDSEEVSKKKREPHPAEVPSPANKHTFVRLPDEVIQEVLQHLNHVDLFHVGQTCVRLNQVAGDRALWTRVDTRNAPRPLYVRELKQLVKFCHEKTKSIVISGNMIKDRFLPITKDTVTPHLFQEISNRCPNLEEFGLENCMVDASKVSVTSFPSVQTLKKLTMVRTEVVHMKERVSWLKDMHKCMPNLVEIDLGECRWLSNHSLMALCKNEKLEKLSLKGCFRIGECFAYTALACRFGFRNLKSFDLRDTFIGNSEVSAVAHLPKLEHIFLGRSKLGPIEEQTSPSSEIHPPESDGTISDRGILSMCVLGGAENKLQTISLAGTDVTNKFMPKLATSFKGLKKLDVRGTGVTESGAEAVKGIRKNCEVLVETVREKVRRASADGVAAGGDDHVVIFAPNMAPAPANALLQAHPNIGANNGSGAVVDPNPIIVVNPANHENPIVLANNQAQVVLGEEDNHNNGQNGDDQHQNE